MKENRINELPKNWVQTQLGEIVQPSKEKINPLNTEKLRYVGLEHIEKDTGQLLGYGSSKEVKSTKSKFSNGDLLYGKLRPYLNKVHLVDFEGICSTDILVFNKQPFIANQFLGLRFLSKDFVEYANQNVNGVQHPRVSFNTLSQFNISLPPLNEQKRIVTKIEALQTRSTAVKEELEAIKPLLDQFRQSVLASAFRGDLTKDWREQNPDVEPASKLVKSSSDLASSNLPISWCPALIGDVVENLKYGTSKKCNYEIDGIPVLRIPNIIGGTIDHSDLKYAELSNKELDKLRLIPGDILMIRSNGSVSLVGRTAIIEEAEKGFAYAGYLIRLRPNRSLVYPKYLNLWFSSFEIRLQIEIPLRSTSGVNNINSNETKKLHIPIAPLEEQKEIVSRIESLFTLADSIEHKYQQAEVDLETLNQSILAKAFRGELVTQDPNDEPASVLLERIKEERDKEITAKKFKTKKKSTKKQNKQLDIPGI